jgi:hypothetical protein
MDEKKPQLFVESTLARCTMKSILYSLYLKKYCHLDPREGPIKDET